MHLTYNSPFYVFSTLIHVIEEVVFRVLDYTFMYHNLIGAKSVERLKS